MATTNPDFHTRLGAQPARSRRALAGLLVVIIQSTVCPTRAWAQVAPQLDPDPAAQQVINQLQPGQGAWLPDFHVVGPAEGLAAHDTFATLGPGIRDYCDKWVYAEDRGRALYAGGNHGAPHKFDDVWEFDLQANTWVMLHAPDPGITPLHTWWGLTYAQDRHLLYWMAPMAFGNWPLVQDNDSPPLLVFDPSRPEQGWQYLDTEPNIRAGFGASLEYIGSRNALLFWDKAWNGAGMQLLDLDSLQWTELMSHDDAYFDNPDAPGAEAIVTYNSSHDVLVGMLDRSVFIYDFASGTWHSAGTDLLPVDVTDHTSGEDYLPSADVHIIFSQGRLFAYHYDSNSIEELHPDDLPRPDEQVMLYVDRPTGLAVLYVEGRTQVYVYKYSDQPQQTDCDAGSCEPRDAGIEDAAPQDAASNQNDGGPDSSTVEADGASDRTVEADAAGTHRTGSQGCGCRAAGTGPSWTFLALLLSIALWVRRRRASRRASRTRSRTP